MKRIYGAVLFVIYSIIAITVTVLLLSFNEYNISEIGEYTIYILKNDSLEPDFKEGSILIMKNTNDRHVNVGDELFFYKVYNSTEFEIVNRKLQDKRQQGRHIIYDVNESETYDTNYFIGKVDDTIVIEGPWGTILSILESKWGYLFCIVIVSLLLFLQEVFDLVIEIKYGGTKGTKAANISNQRKSAQREGVSNPRPRTSTTTKTATKTGTAKPRTTTAKPAAPKATQAKPAAPKVEKAENKVEEEV